MISFFLFYFLFLSLFLFLLVFFFCFLLLYSHSLCCVPISVFCPNVGLSLFWLSVISLALSLLFSFIFPYSPSPSPVLCVKHSYIFVCTCVRACWRAGVRACVRAGVHKCVHACVSSQRTLATREQNFQVQMTPRPKRQTRSKLQQKLVILLQDR